MPDRFGKIPIQNTSPFTPAAEELQEPSEAPPSQPLKLKKRPPARRKKGALLWLGAVLMSFGLYNVLGFLGVPYYLANTLAENFNRKTGMVFQPGQISFNPLTFHFAIENAKILAESGTPMATIQSISADLAPFSLLRMDLVCNTVTLVALDLNITREQDGSYNFDKLLRQKQDGGSSEILNFSDLPFFFSLNNIAIRNGKILFLDSPTGKTHTIENIQLELPTFSNIPFQANQYLRPSFSAVINGSPIELSGQAHMGDSAGEVTTLTCNLHALELPVYAEYLPKNLPLAFTGGKADGKIDLLFDPASQQEDKLSLDFELQLTDTELKSADETVVVTLPATHVKGKLKPVAKTVVFANVSLIEPTLHSIGSSYLSSVNTLFKKEKKVPPTDTTPISPFSLAIDELFMKDGTYHLWKERGVKQPEATWNTLQLSVKNYSSAPSADNKKEPGTFLLSGGREGTASSFSWQGDLASNENLSGSLTLEKIDLKELLLAIGAGQHLPVKGICELKGGFTLSVTQNSDSAIGYKLADSELTVHDFQLIDDKLTVLSSPTLKMTSLGTAYKTIDFGDVSLEDGSVLLSINRIPDIFKHFTTGKYLIQGIDFKGQVTLLSDDKSKQKTTYPDISLQAKDLDTPEKAKENFSISAKTPTGGVVQGQGDIRLAPFSLTIDTEFTGLAASDVFPIMTHSPLLNSLSGVVAGKGVFSLPKRNFAGDMQLSKASIRRTPDSVFSWTDMVLQGVNYISEPFHLGIASTTINKPLFFWQINSNDPAPLQQLATFFQHHLPASDTEKQSGEKPKNTLSLVDLQEIHFNNGNILIQDNRLKPKWKGDVTEFSGKITNIRQPTGDTASEFSFSGKLQDTPFAIKGDTDVFAKEHNGKFQLSLDKFPLAFFHEQLASKTDVNTKSGFLDLQLDFAAKDGQFQNSGSLLFSGVKPVSEKSDSALPLALLTGPDERFQLEFDFVRAEPPGKTVFLEEILTIFQTKVVKASVSPLLLASGDYTDLIGNEFAEFEPGQNVLAPKGSEVLARYAELLNAHPHLGLELSGGIDRDIDTKAMKEQLEALEFKRIEIENQKRHETWLQEKAIFDQKVVELQKKQAAKGKILESNIPPAVLKDFIPIQPKPIIVDDVMLLELAKKRTQFLYHHLTEQLALQSERVTIAPLKRVANTPPGLTDSGVKISLIAIK